VGVWKDEVDEVIAPLLGKRKVLFLATFTLPSNRWREMFKKALAVPDLEVVLLRSNGDWSSLNTFEQDQNDVDPPKAPENLHVILDNSVEKLTMRWGRPQTQGAYLIDAEGVIEVVGNGLHGLINDLLPERTK